MNNEIEKVEFDFQVTEGKIRECLDLEKMLGRKYFYGKGGLNIAIDYNIFLQKEEADAVVDQIRKIEINQALGQELNPLEKIGLQVLLNSYGE